MAGIPSEPAGFRKAIHEYSVGTAEPATGRKVDATGECCGSEEIESSQVDELLSGSKEIAA